MRSQKLKQTLKYILIFMHIKGIFGIYLTLDLDFCGSDFYGLALYGLDMNGYYILSTCMQNQANYLTNT